MLSFIIYDNLHNYENNKVEEHIFQNAVLFFFQLQFNIFYLMSF